MKAERISLIIGEVCAKLGLDYCTIGWNIINGFYLFICKINKSNSSDKFNSV